ncbi:hypothetical protein GCM10023082_43760 [Streptomyces tremellae]|uniref:Uncharacterized protein n=1 Tax=Streptomyces tremellae TaxID=1124239 RepID=A0ABP7FKL0_9ACTN
MGALARERVGRIERVGRVRGVRGHGTASGDRYTACGYAAAAESGACGRPGGPGTGSLPVRRSPYGADHVTAAVRFPSGRRHSTKEAGGDARF